MKEIKSVRLLPQGMGTYDEMDSPVGMLTIIASLQGLHAILWDIDRESGKYEAMLGKLRRSGNDKMIVETKKQLAEYFEARRRRFDLPLVMLGTDFQISVWNELAAIPYGTTISYAEQAGKIGNKNKARAVGRANGLNPLSIVIPCHRVIGSNGCLVGFGGGIDKKVYLLQLEQHHLEIVNVLRSSGKVR